MASAESLNALMPIAQDAGVNLTVEPHVHSYLESPALTLRLLEMVEGLTLTLDYAHFVCMGWCQDEIDVLAPHAVHVHLRQAKPGDETEAVVLRNGERVTLKVTYGRRGES